MTSVVVAIIVVILVVLGWRYLGGQPHGMHKDRRELADSLLFLVRLMENGGKLQARVVDHDTELCFRRVSGDDSSAVVSLEVGGNLDHESLDKANAVLSESDVPGLRDAPIEAGSDSGDWKVEDIWDDSCVAPIVHRIWRLLDALEVPQAARIDFSLDGPRSGRWSRRLRSQH